MAAGEKADANAGFDCIDAGIYGGEAGVGDVQVADLDIPIEFAAEEMDSHRGLRSEVHARNPRWDGLIREENAARDFGVRHDAAIGFKIPFQNDGIEREAVSDIFRLEDNEGGDDVNCKFKPAAEHAGPVRLGEDPTEARAGGPDTCV